MAVLQLSQQTHEIALLLNDSISELWKCSNCENFIKSGTLYKCNQCVQVGCREGEVCKRCNGICNVIITIPMISSITELLAFKCRNKCENRFSMATFDEHMTLCPMRHINCMLGNCMWNGQFKDLDKHIFETHQPTIHYGPNESVFKFSLASSFSKFLFLNGILVLVVVGSNSVFQMYNINENEQIRNMKFKIILRNRKTGKEMIIKNRVLSYQENVYEPSVFRFFISSIGKPTDIDAFLFCGENSHVDDESRMGSIPSIIHNEILRDFECPVCIEPMESHIFQCINGHIFCEKCKNLLATCPVCRVEMKNTSIRNLGLETLAKKISIECPNKIYGCTVKKFCSLMKEHQRTCVYKHIKCPFKLKSGTFCEWNGMPITFAAHCNQFVNEHVYN